MKVKAVYNVKTIFTFIKIFQTLCHSLLTGSDEFTVEIEKIIDSKKK